MMLVKNIILSALLASVSSSEFNNFSLSPKNSPITHTNMAQLFELCFANTSNPIFISENLAETFQKNLSIKIKAPVIIINKNFIAKNIQMYYPTHPMYILSLLNYMDMYGLLIQLISSPFWSQKSKFFLILETRNSCNDAYDILSVMWKVQLLSCIIVCPRTDNETSLYTYNPYTKRAPDPWVETNITWLTPRVILLTLFNQSFTTDYKICETIFFDKTEILDGYPVKVGSTLNKTFELDFIINSLNMTQQVTYFGLYNITFLSVWIIQGNTDVTTFGSSQENNMVHPVPMSLDGYFVIITQKASFLSVSSEIAQVLDINGVIAIILFVLLITFLIVLHNKYQIGLAVLDVLKMMMSMGINSPLDRLAMKITFFTGFLFVFIFSPLLEGQLLATITNPATYNMESLKDLYDHKYYVIYPMLIHDSILEKNLWDINNEEENEHISALFVYSDTDICLKYVIEMKNVACITSDFESIDYAVKHNLHISQPLLKKSNVCFTRPFWSLTDRFYYQALNLQEFGLLVEPSERKLRKFHDNLKKKKRIEKRVNYQPVDAVDLIYLYQFMAFFQFLAIIVFGIEYIVGRHRRPRQ
ncbi:uncharacterized protein LOC103570672 isoform X1 [Microplitis demolitor]|uniref:uncharacterized protein LOC103570672 isoform X1 n=1 Tax=Microplitis demolitor TaxID=69319 RepID=UPI00235B5E04|nr:uncharacterized protein LOC103570672 isoform X1 [Microplitis demolitor]